MKNGSVDWRIEQSCSIVLLNTVNALSVSDEQLIIQTVLHPDWGCVCVCCVYTMHPVIMDAEKLHLLNNLISSHALGMTFIINRQNRRTG